MYLPNSTKAISTGIYTCLGNQDVDFNTLYAKNSSGPQIKSSYGISTGADIASLFYPCTADISVNNLVTNTLLCAVLCTYGFSPWGVKCGISISPHPFTTTKWTNYWIYTTSSDISSADNNQYSFQQSCVSYASTSLNASLTALCDNYINYVYLNNTKITNY